jgi:hypothetical protein
MDDEHLPEQKPSFLKRLWLKRVGWLVAIWTLSITALAVVSFGLKFLMRAVGFHT